jgi:hypothetical protein
MELLTLGDASTVVAAAISAKVTFLALPLEIRLEVVSEVRLKNGRNDSWPKINALYKSLGAFQYHIFRTDATEGQPLILQAQYVVFLVMTEGVDLAGERGFRVERLYKAEFSLQLPDNSVCANNQHRNILSMLTIRSRK